MLFSFFRNSVVIFFLGADILLSDIISFSDLELPAGSSGELQLSLSNDTILGGFQFQIIDFPDQVYVENVVVTDRTSAFTVSFNEQIDGSVIVVGFDLSGQGLDAGQGSILELTYTSTGIYTANIDEDETSDASKRIWTVRETFKNARTL